LLLKSRDFQNIAFITDCVLEGVPGKTIKYGNRESEAKCKPPEEGVDGGVGITANTKILGHLTANGKKSAVTVKINK